LARFVGCRPSHLLWRARMMKMRGIFGFALCRMAFTVFNAGAGGGGDPDIASCQLRLTKNLARFGRGVIYFFEPGVC